LAAHFRCLHYLAACREGLLNCATKGGGRVHEKRIINGAHNLQHYIGNQHKWWERLHGKRQRVPVLSSCMTGDGHIPVELRVCIGLQQSCARWKQMPPLPTSPSNLFASIRNKHKSTHTSS
jgi:hypothetical protein